MKSFAILRTAKITSLAGLSGASAHNNRTAETGLDHADNHNPQMGGGVVVMGDEDAVRAWHRRVDEVGGIPKPRKDAVRAVEFVLSASPEWFASASPADKEAWRDKSLAWVTTKLGADNVLQATLHDDEGNPHLHVLGIPLTLKTRKRAGRRPKGRPVADATTAPS